MFFYCKESAIGYALTHKEAERLKQSAIQTAGD